MSSKHQISSDPADILLPTAERMTNGAYLYADRNEDALGRLGKAINDIFNWRRPVLIEDAHYVEPWNTDLSGLTPMAYYRVPAWQSGVGGAFARQDLRSRFSARTAGGAGNNGTIIATVTWGDGAESVGGNEAFTAGWAEYTDTNTIHDGDERLDVAVFMRSLSSGNTIHCKGFRLEWEPRTDFLLSVDSSKKYGGAWANKFLPNDCDHLRTDYNPGSVERVRRLREDVYELLIRFWPT